MKKLLQNLIPWFVSGLLLSIYFLLAFKNPFSTRSLVPNLEPFPDALYYSYPAWHFLHGGGFNMDLSIGMVKNIVPPLYTLYLLPFFALASDVRVFYIANMVLMFGAIVFFILACKASFKTDVSIWVSILIAGLILVTNFFFYNSPSLLMAENPSLFVTAFAWYLLRAETNYLKIILAGQLGLILLLIKFSNLPLAVAFSFLYFMKLWEEKKTKEFIFSYITSLAVSAVCFVLFGFLGGTFLHNSATKVGDAFSLKYLIPNGLFYLSTFFGGNAHYLWYSELLVSRIIGALALVGVMVSLSSTKLRRMGIEAVVLILTTVVFMGTFYVQDARYVLYLLPIFIWGFFTLVESIRLKTPPIIFIVIVSLFLCAYLFVPTINIKNEPIVTSLKKQIGLNFLHSEIPWNYLAVIEFNNFFNKPLLRGAYLGTVLPPHFVAEFSNETYQYLPITLKQDFFNDKNNLGDQMGIRNISDYYRKMLEKKNRIYLSNYYLNNLPSWQEDFNKLTSQFKTTIVKQGCLGSCNIYLIQLP